MGKRRGAALLLAAFIATVATASCKLLQKHPGDKCTSEGKAQCTSATAALLCRGGTLVDLPCRGKSGCTRVEPAICDDDVAIAGDDCVEPAAASDQNLACTADGTTLLVCKGGKFAVAAKCRGKDACKATSDVSKKGRTTTVHTDVACDDTVMEAGDPCLTSGRHACSVDRKALLECKDGAMVASLTCRGPEACSVAAGDEPGKVKWDCDDSVTEAGDPCGREGRHTCSVDGGTWLVCKDGKMKPDNSCRGPKGCTTTPARDKPHTFEMSCDDSRALLGDPCEPDGEHACAVDGKSMLVCKAGVYATQRACFNGCTVAGKVLHCL